MSAHAANIVAAQPADLTLDGVAERMAPHADRVEELIRRYPVKRAALLQVLWLIQEEFGWVPRIAIKWAAGVCDVSPVHAFSVVEFYTMYKQVPPARFHIRICRTMTCHLFGAENLVEHVEKKLGIACGEHTEDSMFALETVECLAACGNAPAIQINDEFLFGPGDELNTLEDGWSAKPEDLDRWIDILRSRAKADPNAGKADELGGIILHSDGHPGAPEACADVLPGDYAPPPPALGVKIEGNGEAITVTGLIAPECQKVVLERSDDGGTTWSAIADGNPADIPGPPGPKNVPLNDTLSIGASAHYRMIAHNGERIAEPSATVSITASEAAPESQEGDA